MSVKDLNEIIYAARMLLEYITGFIPSHVFDASTLSRDVSIFAVKPGGNAAQGQEILSIHSYPGAVCDSQTFMLKN